MADEFGHYNAAARMHEVIKTAAASEIAKLTPNRFIGWVIDARFDSSPNYGPIDIDNIGKPGSLVKVATETELFYNTDGTVLTDVDGKTISFPDRTKGVIRAYLPGNYAPVVDGTAVWVEGSADTDYHVVDTLPTAFINFFQKTKFQNTRKFEDILISGKRSGLLHTYDTDFDYPLGNDPTKTLPARTLENLCTNPGFEVSAANWVPTAGTTIAPSTTHKSKGTNGGGITWSTTDANAAVRIPFNTEVGEVYTAAIKIWNNIGSGWIGLGDGPTGAPVVKTAYYNAEVFGIKYVQFNAISTLSNLDITLQSIDASGTLHMWIDEIVITKGAAIVAAFDGSDAGCSWTGATGLSTSVKAVPATPPLFDSFGTSVKYGTPLYVPFYSPVIGLGQTYYLGRWDRGGWDTPEAFVSHLETSSGEVEFTVKLWAGNDTTLGGTVTDPKFDTNGTFVIKRYRFNAVCSSYSGQDDWVLIYPESTSGPKNGVDFEIEILTRYAGEFALRILYTREDSPTRTPRFIGSLSGWADVENVTDITESDPNSITDIGHRGTIQYQALHYKAKDTSDLWVNQTGSFDPARNKGPLLSPSNYFPSLAQACLSDGAAEWSYKSGCISWGGLLTSSPGGRNYFQADGYSVWNAPSVGQVIPVFGQAGVTSVTVTANGIPLVAGQTLYAEMWVGGQANTGTPDLRIVSSNDLNQHFEVPSHWLMVASIDPYGDIKTGTGKEFLLSTGFSGWSPWAALTLGAKFLYSDAAFFRPAFRYNIDIQKTELRGLIRSWATGGTHTTPIANETFATIPVVAARCPVTIMVSTFSGVTGSPETPRRLNTNATGVLFLTDAIAFSEYIMLDNLSFSLAANF